MRTVGVGLVGSGFVAELHMSAYRRVFGVDAQVRAVCARGDHVRDFARRHGIAATCRDFRELLTDPAIDVIDLCTPPATHAEMVVACMQAGKHVICEKPFTGYFGNPGDPTPIGLHVPKAVMFARVVEQMDRVAAAIRSSGKLFLYAEDWIYAPAIRKTAEMIRATKDKILFIKAEESHSGSHAAHAARWDMTGGGALLRQGCHPLSAVLHLKQVEASARNETVAVADLTCDVGQITGRVPHADREFLNARPVDVEDWGLISLTFTDGTKAAVFAADMILGGVRNLVETYTTGGVLLANIAPNNHMVSYQTDEAKLEGVYITEKVDRKTGWQMVCLEEEWTRGYQQEIQDFMECVTTGRQPLAGLDLAYDAIRIHYAAYQAAEEGRRIVL
ncbi:MAG: Gfo/Idh/MocA family oxidoreductase [Acetobacteraceae bacterium]|nr:Gfo/Idh/MocA family oxidoreductase [Acetobacteraceae bacterium]